MPEGYLCPCCGGIQKLQTGATFASDDSINCVVYLRCLAYCAAVAPSSLPAPPNNGFQWRQSALRAYMRGRGKMHLCNTHAAINDGRGSQRGL